TWAQAGAALSFEGFRASLSPLDPRVVDARPAPGQAACASELRRLLAAGSLARDGGRRLQDPLSFRCASQVHGSLATALDLLAAALEPELNGSGDNPLVLVDSGEIVSTGNFLVPGLALAADAVALALAQVANLSAARAARLLTAKVSDLPQNLAPAGSTSRCKQRDPSAATSSGWLQRSRECAPPERPSRSSSPKGIVASTGRRSPRARSASRSRPRRRSSARRSSRRSSDAPALQFVE